MIDIDGRSIRIIQHNSGEITFEFYGPDGNELLLTDYKVTFMVKHSKKDLDSEAIITRVFSQVDGSSITIGLTSQDTDHPVDAYWWSVKLENNTYVNEALSGPFFILEGVQD